MFNFSPIEIVIVFILGISVGSFLNCFTYRLYRKKSIRGRSFCDQCKHPLTAKDLIPLFSYLLMKGRCSYCKKEISSQHFFVELATGVLFVLFYNPTDIITLFYLLFTASLLLLLFLYDLRHRVVLNTAIYLLILSSLFYVEEVEKILFASLFFVFFLAISVFNKAWIRIGDALFIFFITIFLGPVGLLIVLFISFLIGAIIKIGRASCRERV